MFARWADNASYRRSQAATAAPLRPSAVARGLALQVLSSGDDAAFRERVAQHLVDELSREAGLPPCQVVVPDRPQVHRHDGHRLQMKTYGYYRFTPATARRPAHSRIRIYHRTAVQQRPISPKVFLNTVLHEWMHHYDFHGLQLARSYHTAGFFLRLRGLAAALDVAFVLPPDPDGRAPNAGHAVSAPPAVETPRVAPPAPSGEDGTPQEAGRLGAGATPSG
jgi:hypothetical protein